MITSSTQPIDREVDPRTRVGQGTDPVEAASHFETAPYQAHLRGHEIENVRLAILTSTPGRKC